MSKKLVIGLALALVLVSGTFFTARADCGCFHFHWPSCFSLSNFHWPSLCCNSARDKDIYQSNRDIARDAVPMEKSNPTGEY